MKENKGGFLRNEQIEQDLKAKGRNTANESYEGSQDTGDKTVRQEGADVQRRDGGPQPGAQNEEE